MPAISETELSALRKETTPIGLELPDNYESRAKFHELSIQFSMPVDHRKLDNWMTEYNTDLPTENQITVEKIVEASRAYELKQMRWNSYRLPEVGATGPEPIGWEHLYVGKPWDNDVVTLRICIRGFLAQVDYPGIINPLLIGGGYQALNLEQLIKADQVIKSMLNNEKTQMTKEAKQFRQLTMTQIDDLPRDLTQSYYFKAPDEKILVVGTVLQKLPPHASFQRPVNWYQVLNYATTSGFKHVTLPELRNGRLIMERLSHMTASFPHGMLDAMRNSRSTQPNAGQV